MKPFTYFSSSRQHDIRYMTFHGISGDAIPQLVSIGGVNLRYIKLHDVTMVYEGVIEVAGALMSAKNSVQLHVDDVKMVDS